MLRRGVRGLQDVPILFQSYTPSWVSTGVQPAIGNGQINGRFARSGKFVFFEVNIIMGTTTTFGTGDYHFTLPSTFRINSQLGSVWGAARALDTGVANRGGQVMGIAGGVQDRIRCLNPGLTTFWGAASPHAWGNADELIIMGEYEEP